MKHEPVSLRSVAEQVSGIRREGASDSLLRFAEWYLPDHFTLPASPMHAEIMDTLSTAIPRGRARLAAAIPHGFGKTTIASIALPLWALAYRHCRHCVVLSDTRPRAGEALACVARELVTNRRLLSDFPHLRGVRTAGPSARDLVLSGARMSVASRATGLGGRRFGPHRPDLIIVDEVEGVGAKFRPVDEEWLSGAVIAPGSSEANVVVVGTLWNNSSIIEELLGHAEGGRDAGAAWWGRRYKAVLAYPHQMELWIRFELVFHGIAEYEGRSGPDAAAALVTARRDEMVAGARLLWPERTAVADLLQRKVREGWWRFDAAFQSHPLGDEIQVVMDLDGRCLSPPYKWTDDANMVRDSFQNNPATGRILFPHESQKSHQGWDSLRIELPGRARKPRRDLVPPTRDAWVSKAPDDPG
jgi:hypothetical protein